MALFDTIRAGASGAATDYEIARSLRFDRGSSTRLSRTFGSSGNRRTFTFSAWLKVSGRTNNHLAFFSGAGGSDFFKFMFRDGGDFRLEINTVENGSDSTQIKTKAKFRDIHAWFHLIIAFDTTQGTSSNRVKIYVNGVQQTSFDSSSFPSQNHQVSVNKNIEHQVGNQVNTSNHFDGYMAEVNFIDGQQLTPSSFAETDSTTGEYKPIKYTGSYGTNGFYLNFLDNSGTSSTTLGKDSSGNGNNFTPTNFSVSSGNGNDSVEDSPTNNWCTLSPYLGKTRSNASFSNGNMKVTTGSGASNIGCTFGVSSGKWYAEFKCTAKSSVHFMIGVASIFGFDGERQTNESQSDGFGLAYLGGDSSPTGNKMTDGGGSSSYGAAYNTGDIIGVKLDMDNKTVNFAKNNSYQGSLSISTTKGDATTNFFTFCMGGGQGGATQTFEANFGASGFTYTPPSGFLALNSKNLAESNVKKGSDYMFSKTYTGTGSQQAIGGLDFSPDWVWVKRRNSSSFHIISNTVLGANNYLVSNNTDAESVGGGSQLINGFNSDGFDVGTESAVNASGGTYVGWCWEAGSSTVTNTSGSINSQVRAVPEAGFAIVTYSGNGSNATIGHGLGIKPSSYIIKRRDSGSGNTNWRVYHAQMNQGSSPEEFHLQLNSSDQQAGQSNIFNDTQPTSSVFSIGTHASTGENGGNFVAYVFAEIPGYSKFGMYKGTGGNDNNALVFCGFRPHWILLKKITGGETWCLIDTSRDTFNVGGGKLAPNNTNSESSITGGDRCDIYSCGFKPRDGAGQFGGGGATYVYWAFAENPFKIARAR